MDLEIALQKWLLAIYYNNGFRLDTLDYIYFILLNVEQEMTCSKLKYSIVNCQ